jgi:hypothetical protein
MLEWEPLETGKCVLFNVPLTAQGDFKDSRAHVIASALGGRFKPLILCARKNADAQRQANSRKPSSVHVSPVNEFV